MNENKIGFQPLTELRKIAPAGMRVLPKQTDAQKAASMLGKLGRGKKKTLSAPERQRRRELMNRLNQGRRLK